MSEHNNGVARLWEVPEWKDLSWQEHAACRGTDPEFFYYEGDERGNNYRAKADYAKRICAVCPVRLECLTDAVERDDRFSIQGGTTPKDRGVVKWTHRNHPLEIILERMYKKEKDRWTMKK